MLLPQCAFGSLRKIRAYFVEGTEEVCLASHPRLIVDRALETGRIYDLEPEAKHYLVHVLRLRRGDRFTVVDALGRAFRALLTSERNHWKFEVLCLEPAARTVQERLAVCLILGLLKSDRTEWAIQKATEVGVSEVRVVICERSIPKPLKDPERRALRLCKVAEEAARQCGRASVPKIALYPDLATALENLCSGPKWDRFWLDESPSARPLASYLKPCQGVVVAVGPEGSYSKTEREALDKAGFLPAGLGPRVLRAETAAVVALTVVQAIIGDLAPRPFAD